MDDPAGPQPRWPVPLAVPVADALDHLLASADPGTIPQPEFRGLQFDAGLAEVHHPVGRGGLGADPAEQLEVERRLSAAGATP